MGIFDKVKKILFDEDEVEIPIEEDELPERENKPKEKPSIIEKTKNVGFIDYGNKEEDIEEEEEAPIKKVEVPVETEEKHEKEFSFPIINDYDEIPTRSKEPVEVKVEKKDKNLPRRDYASLINTEKKHSSFEERDYHKILGKKKETVEGKKPFTVTPVISPVFGYIEETKEAEQELISVPKVEVDPTKPRMFGPVSYNDTPLPVKKIKSDIKEEVVELKHDIEEIVLDDEDDMILSTPNYDEIDSIETSGIENRYTDNTSIEDAFESTRELESIDYNDSLFEEKEVEEVSKIEPEDKVITEEIPIIPNLEEEIEEKEEIVSTDDIIEETKSDDFEDEDAHLDDTIETDLFNLIDSMYNSDDDEEEEVD